jgi:hypothetical protein
MAESELRATTQAGQMEVKAKGMGVGMALACA